MKKVVGFAVLVIALLLGARTPASAWTPPIGIPMPAFGINETAPPRPYPWTTPVPGFYYVDATVPSATDSGNDYGTPGRPRQRIPWRLPAGSVVEVHGTYTFDHTSPYNIRVTGTASQPVFIRGMDASTRPTIQATWALGGTYLIAENLNFAPGKVSVVAPANHVVLRHSEVGGTVAGGGVAVVSFAAEVTGEQATNVVIWDNYIHDNGDVGASFDQDVHGIAVGYLVDHLWIVDNEIARNSGDGIQINAGTLATQGTTHHIYVGRNHLHSNKQGGMWTKQANDVIFSQNTIHSHRPGNSSSGACAGGQYGPTRVWFLFNHIYDCESGIRIESVSGLGTGGEVYSIGNLIHDISDTRTPKPDNPHGSGAIVIRGNDYHWVVNNTFYKYQAGVMNVSAFVYLENNIFASRTNAQARDIFIALDSLAAGSTMRNNLVPASPRLQWGRGFYTTSSAFQAATGKCQGCFSTDTPGFVNSGAGDFHLAAAAVAVDKGITSAVYQTFFTLYGIDLAKDIAGTPRPQGPSYDLGAYEFANEAMTPPMPLAAPTHVR
jgi:parallel beta helix pectate lyase-like protein